MLESRTIRVPLKRASKEPGVENAWKHQGRMENFYAETAAREDNRIRMEPMGVVDHHDHHDPQEEGFWVGSVQLGTCLHALLRWPATGSSSQGGRRAVRLQYGAIAVQ